MKPVFLGIILLFWGCASSTPQSNKVLADFKGLPPQATVENVPFFLQTEGHCGPATLAMALNHAGIEASVDELARSAFSPESNGSYQMDMISTVRRKKALALPLTGMENLLTEVASGNPVIVFENLGVEWLPQWHYAIVFGHDLEKEKVHMHSGAEKNKVWDIRKFERSWKLGDYWGLVVLPPGKLAQTVSEKEHLRAAAALEKLGHLDAAEKSYQAMAKRWKNSHMPLIGLGNIAFLKGKYPEAQSFYLKASKIKSDLPFIWRNLALAYQKTGSLQEAEESAAKAAQFAKNAAIPKKP